VWQTSASSKEITNVPEPSGLISLKKDEEDINMGNVQLSNADGEEKKEVREGGSRHTITWSRLELKLGKPP